MQLERRAPCRRTLISLTPLIDVVFILLLFFLLASHFQQWRALRADATPTTRTQAEDAQTPTFLLRLRNDGRLDLGGAALSEHALAERLRDSVEHHPDLRVQIQPDAEVDLQTLVSLMDLVLAAGVREMSLE